MPTFKPRTKTIEAISFAGYRNVWELVNFIETNTAKRVGTVTLQQDPDSGLTFLDSGSGICMKIGDWLVIDEGACRVLSNTEFQARYETTKPDGPRFFVPDLKPQEWPKHIPQKIDDLYGPITCQNVR